MAYTSTAKDLHDQLLAEMPELAQHDSAVCPFCSMQSSAEDNGGKMSETFTKEEVQAQIDAAVASATRELAEKLAEIETSQSEAESEAKIAEVRAEVEEKVTALQAELDAKVIELEQVNTEFQNLVALLEETEAARLEAEAVEARKEERVAQVAAVAAFPESYVTENADRWAAMSDELFEATLADYQAVAEKASAFVKTAAGATTVPEKTALQASRDEHSKMSAVRELSQLRRNGFDPRQVVR